MVGLVELIIVKDEASWAPSGHWDTRCDGEARLYGFVGGGGIDGLFLRFVL